MVKIEAIQCNRCGKEFSVRSMIADQSGKGLVCQSCYDVIARVRTDADKLIQKRMHSTEKTIGDRKVRYKEGKEYFCRACNYKFIAAQPTKKCPYCGKEDSLTVVEKVVKEIDDLLRKY